METHRGLLSVQEHREETLIYDVEVVKSNAMKIKEHREDLVIRGLFLRPLSALLKFLGLSWGTVGAYQFDMLKKQESSATAVKQRPAVVGWARGETLSKQVYLGRV